MAEPLTIEECASYKHDPLINSILTSDQFAASKKRENLNRKDEPSFENNLFKNYSPIIWHKNENLDSRSVFNTFNYLFHKFKRGLFIRIANNKLEEFKPFININFRNEFSDVFQINPKFNNPAGYLKHLSEVFGLFMVQKHPVEKWEDNYFDSVDESDNNMILLNMFQNLCKERDVPDIEFFINDIRPLMKVDDTEPYNHIWNSNHQPLKSHLYKKYAPILSGSGSDMYADIAIPTYEDWGRIQYGKTSGVFPLMCREYPDIELTPWSKKYNRVVFRGSLKGTGVTPDTNQRFKAFVIGNEERDILDIGITDWNIRPRKIENFKYMKTINVNGKLPHPKDKMILQEQSTYFKYILTLEGDSAAFRLSYELSSGSVILLAASQWHLWFYHMLKPYYHYVPIKEDLSDLISQIEWCNSNDKQCSEIAKNARIFYDKYLGRKGVLDFLQKTLWDLSAKTTQYEYLPDLIKWSIENEKNQLLEEIKFKNIIYNFPISDSVRSIGLLDSIQNVMRSKSLKDLTWNSLITKNKGGRIDLFTVNGVKIIGKKSDNPHKELEHIHENYIGLKAVNRLVARVPNFAYIFGPIKDSTDMVFSEFIEGTRLLDWLINSYNFKDFLSILIQINLAITVAQNYIGFIHYDLYPWNVMIKSLTGDFTYSLNQKSIVSIKTNLVPVIIDYGKSRAIVHEPKYGNVDHGFANLFQQNSIVDTLMILYSCLDVLRNNKSIGPNEMKLLDFPKRIGLKNYKDVKYWSKFGMLYKFKPKTVTGKYIIPKNFIDFLIDTFKDSAPVLRKASQIEYPMENGVNPVIAEAYMRYGDINKALYEMIKHVDRSRPVMCDDDFYNIFVENILRRRLSSIDSLMGEQGSEDNKEKWVEVRKLLFIKIQDPRPLSFDYPSPTDVPLDSEVTPDYIRMYEAEKNEEDWMMTWLLCLEAFFFGTVTEEGAFGDFIRLNGFLYHNAIASNNTLLKIKDLLLINKE
jgi:hypothetical protein